MRRLFTQRGGDASRYSFVVAAPYSAIEDLARASVVICEDTIASGWQIGAPTRAKPTSIPNTNLYASYVNHLGHS